MLLQMTFEKMAKAALLRSGQVTVEDAVTRDIRWPARGLPVARRFGDPTFTLGTHLLKFASQLSAQFDAIFPP